MKSFITPTKWEKNPGSKNNQTFRQMFEGFFKAYNIVILQYYDVLHYTV